MSFWLWLNSFAIKMWQNYFHSTLCFNVNSRRATQGHTMSHVSYLSAAESRWGLTSRFVRDGVLKRHESILTCPRKTGQSGAERWLRLEWVAWRGANTQTHTHRKTHMDGNGYGPTTHWYEYEAWLKQWWCEIACVSTVCVCVWWNGRYSGKT